MKALLLFLTILPLQAFACLSQTIELKNTLNGENFHLVIKAYSPKVESKSQVIIMPPIGGSTTLENRYAKKICNRGAKTFILYKWTNDNIKSITDLGVHEKGTQRGLHAINTFLEYSPKDTNILGTSLGGIYAGIAIGRFDLIKKVVIIASGTNLAGILSDSTLPELLTLKIARKKHFNFTSDAEYFEALKREVNSEAIDYQHNLAYKKLLFFKTNSDSVIRTKYQDELISLFQKDNTRVVRTKYGHKKGIIFTYLKRSNFVANFLTRK
jgi:hypothetical protein